MKALARKASKLAICGAAGLCAQKSAASDKILNLCRNSSLAAKIGAGGLVCATPLALKLGAGVALKFAARKILTFGICELSKSAALKCAKLGARAVVRSFSRTGKFTDERSKKRASADNENFNAGITPHRKRAASISSANVKKDASLSKSATIKKNTATKSAPAKKSPLAKKIAPTVKAASTAKSVAAGAASASVAKSTSVAKSASTKSAAQNKISAPSAKAIPAKSVSQNVKSRRIAKNTATPTVIAAKDVVASGASSASAAKQPRRAAKSASAKSSAAGKS
ncbi:hypothetical protein [uncultured Campylobacter sp.]|uniref:hypothetical protein n=1 Tax=uncultured Campylobacter sp. TaxID=218934 RepID=UPI00260F1158|nr:hypothetical protein [uncultured Campylobacter sp.]